MTTSPWDLTEAQLFQIREAHAEEKQRARREVMDLLDAEPEVQWAVRYDSDSGRPHVGTEESEESAREQAAKEPYPGTRRTVVKRTVIYGEWEEADV